MFEEFMAFRDVSMCGKGIRLRNGMGARFSSAEETVLKDQ